MTRYEATLEEGRRLLLTRLDLRLARAEEYALRDLTDVALEREAEIAAWVEMTEGVGAEIPPNMALRIRAFREWVEATEEKEIVEAESEAEA